MVISFHIDSMLDWQLNLLHLYSICDKMNNIDRVGIYKDFHVYISPLDLPFLLLLFLIV